MTEIILSIAPYAVGLLAIMGGLFGIYVTGKRSGRGEAERDADKALIDGMKKARDARDEISEIDDAGIRDRARRRMHDSAGS